MTLEKMTSRRQSTEARIRLRVVGAMALLAGSMILGGCSLLPAGSSATTEGTTPAAAPVATQAAAVPEVKTAAQELQTKVKATLESLASVAKAPSREQVMQAMVDAGATQENVEVSVDITPTGLAVDAIEAATLVDKECVIGQVRSGEVAVTILPVLASGRCFVGDVH
ncbi:DUF6993 domain-containing protein [Arthrobacter psychrolactophilus]